MWESCLYGSERDRVGDCPVYSTIEYLIGVAIGIGIVVKQNLVNLKLAPMPQPHKR